MFLNLFPLFFFVVRLFLSYPENARAACMIHLPAHVPDCYWMLQWPGKLRLFARKSVRFLRRFLVLVFVFVRLWLCLFRQVLQVESLCVWLCVSTWMWQRNLCHEPIFIPYSKKIAHSSKELLLFFRSNNTHTYSEWLDEWAEPVSAYACTLSFYIALYLYSLVRYSVFTFVTLWPRAYLSLHTNAYATHSIFFRTWPFIHGRHTLKTHPHLSHHHIHNIPIWYGNWTNRSICKCSRYMWAFKTAVKIEKSKRKERHENEVNESHWNVYLEHDLETALHCTVL